MPRFLLRFPISLDHVKTIALSICAAFLLWATCYAVEAANSAVSSPPIFTVGHEPAAGFQVPSDQGTKAKNIAALLLNPQAVGLRFLQLIGNVQAAYFANWSRASG